VALTVRERLIKAELSRIRKEYRYHKLLDNMMINRRNHDS
jgi:hypothetical protein